MVRHNPVARACAPVARGAAILSGYALLFLSVLITYDVIMRKLFNTSSVGADEIGGYIVAAMAAFGFTYALLQHAHTRIDVFYQWMPTPVRVAANLMAMGGLFLFAGFIAWRGWGTLMESIEFGSVASTPLHTPQWIPQSIWVAGLALFGVVSLMLLIHALWLVLRGQSRRSLQLYGPQTLAEEIERERMDVEGLDDHQPAPPASLSGETR
ncbi:TRAP transporter small permease [Castellaniella sp. GW247-6E4]|uniref:TRAP transporter small permease subunit n=1 Tax=Castellaniella sp. GW247-6E4 TaxID=3140380 RepID=UPI003315CD33